MKKGDHQIREQQLALMVGEAIKLSLSNLKLREKLRKSDIACRYGGEEFVIVMPDSSLEDTFQRVEEIRVLVKKLEIRYGEQLLGTITISAGIAGTRENGGITIREFLNAADTALYAAKQAGRDRVVVYQEKE